MERLKKNLGTLEEQEPKAKIALPRILEYKYCVDLQHWKNAERQIPITNDEVLTKWNKKSRMTVKEIIK
jgi:hypothetical protein